MFNQILFTHLTYHSSSTLPVGLQNYYSKYCSLFLSVAHRNGPPCCNPLWFKLWDCRADYVFTDYYSLELYCPSKDDELRICPQLMVTLVEPLGGKPCRRESEVIRAWLGWRHWHPGLVSSLQSYSPFHTDWHDALLGSSPQNVAWNPWNRVSEQSFSHWTWIWSW